jgi:uncharacterized protein YdaU (DUF1376 family)
MLLNLMAKDPAFLFYSSDFLTGTQFFTHEQRGKYITLLCLQHQTGHLSSEDMIKICGTHDKDIFKKFTKDDAGLYFNERLEIEVNKRRNFSESRRKNRLGDPLKPRPAKGKKMSKSYVPHMENENENSFSNNNSKGRKKKFTPPTLEDVKVFFREKGYSEYGAAKAHEHYELADWHDTHGNPVLSWKQKMNTNWLKPEFKIKPKTVNI